MAQAAQGRPIPTWCVEENSTPLTAQRRDGDNTTTNNNNDTTDDQHNEHNNNTPEAPELTGRGDCPPEARGAPTARHGAEAHEPPGWTAPQGE